MDYYSCSINFLIANNKSIDNYVGEMRLNPPGSKYYASAQVANFFNEEDKGWVHIKREVKYSPCCVVFDVLVDLKGATFDKTLLMTRVGEHTCLLIDEHYMLLKMSKIYSDRPEVAVVLCDDYLHDELAVLDCFLKEHDCQYQNERQEEYQESVMYADFHADSYSEVNVYPVQSDPGFCA